VYNVANGTSKSIGPLTVDLAVKQVPFATLYTRPSDDGLEIGPKRVEAW
jgi:hypothetical protein